MPKQLKKNKGNLYKFLNPEGENKSETNWKIEFAKVVKSGWFNRYDDGTEFHKPRVVSNSTPRSTGI